MEYFWILEKENVTSHILFYIWLYKLDNIWSSIKQENESFWVFYYSVKWGFPKKKDYFFVLSINFSDLFL